MARTPNREEIKRQMLLFLEEHDIEELETIMEEITDDGDDGQDEDDSDDDDDGEY